jgi:metal-responsive CopG/Arc/MetJ family transcriptional regulator
MYTYTHGWKYMKTIQMTVDIPLLAELDQVVQSMHTTRSAFIREALQLALRQYRVRQLEQKHARGYSNFPPTPDEFTPWESEQIWGDE